MSNLTLQNLMRHKRVQGFAIFVVGAAIGLVPFPADVGGLDAYLSGLIPGVESVASLLAVVGFGWLGLGVVQARGNVGE